MPPPEEKVDEILTPEPINDVLNMVYSSKETNEISEP